MVFSLLLGVRGLGMRLQSKYVTPNVIMQRVMILQSVYPTQNYMYSGEEGNAVILSASSVILLLCWYTILLNHAIRIDLQDYGHSEQSLGRVM